MIALFAASSALAGDLVLTGGVASTPDVGSLVVPTWRAGWADDHLHVWGSAAFASFAVDLGEDFEPRRIAGFVVRPRVGARWAFGDGPLRPTAQMSTATAIFGFSGDRDQLLEDEDVSGRLPVAATASGGLLTTVTEAIGVGVEFGADYENAAFVEGRSRVTSISTLSTYAALTLELRL